MNRLDREIMKQILTEQQSAYSVNEQLRKNGEKSNYATLWRHIKKMKNEKLLAVSESLRKNGKIDNRNTELLSLTNKGLATLLIEGDLQENESNSLTENMIQNMFGTNLFGPLAPFMAQIFSDTLIRIKPRVNLKFFDEDYFKELFLTIILETLQAKLNENQLKMDKETLLELFSKIQNRAKKEGAEQLFQKGFEFGKKYRELKESEE